MVCFDHGVGGFAVDDDAQSIGAFVRRNPGSNLEPSTRPSGRASTGNA